MGRLTEKDSSGNWSVKGLSWNELFTGQTITKRKQEIIYGCLAKLKDYEDSELSPEQVQQYKDSGWIPVSERYPDNDDYILLSFENFSLPTVGRYEEDEEGGAFFVGDDDISCVSSGLYVNAWRPLPAIYKDGMSMTNADRIRSMSDEELADSWPCPYDTVGSNIMPCMLDDDVKGAPTEECCHKCIMNWLQKEVKE